MTDTELRAEMEKRILSAHTKRGYSVVSRESEVDAVVALLLRAHYEAKAEAMEEARSMCPEFVPLQYDPWFEIDCLAVKYRALAKGVKE